MRKKAARAVTSSPEEAPFLPITSPVGDARKLHRHATATADELRAFLSELRGKNPREMLGDVANSDLGRSLIVATVGAAVLIGVFTVLPFAWARLSAQPAPTLPAPIAEDPPTTEASPIEAAPAAGAPTNPLETEAAADSLGIGESKPAPPTVNPLDSANDDLLKGLE